MIAVTQSLVDYVFKFSLAKHFTGRELGSFYGYYSGITNLVAIIVGLSTTKYILKA